MHSLFNPVFLEFSYFAYKILVEHRGIKVSKIILLSNFDKTSIKLRDFLKFTPGHLSNKGKFHSSINQT